MGVMKMKKIPVSVRFTNKIDFKISFLMSILSFQKLID